MIVQKLSLVQRLWLLLLLMMTLSVGGALVANLLNARRYLEQQLTEQSVDTANALALMVTQYKADRPMAQALLNAAFEQGHFAEIRWDVAPRRAFIQLRGAGGSEDSPAWFRQLLPLYPQPGVAQVSKGWMQAGHIVVVAEPGYAYHTLWTGAVQTVLWLTLTGLAAAGLGFLDIRRLRRQLSEVIAQAQAISEQRFVQIAVPAIPELAEVVRAMNHMVERLQNYLGRLRDEVDRLQKAVLTDSSTGLPNREAFMLRFARLLEMQDDPLAGFLLLIRVAGLAELNQRMGGRKTDVLLKHIADDLLRHCRAHQGWMATRLRGADFALVCPELDPEEARVLACELCGLWPVYQSMALTDQAGVGHLGVAAFRTGDSAGQVLERASQALTLAQAGAPNSWKLDAGRGEEEAAALDLDWKQLIEQSCQDASLALRWYPVCHPDGAVLWYEGMLFRPQTDSMPQMGALRLVAHALRLGLAHRLDLCALWLALSQGPDGVLAVNLSPASLAHADFLPQVMCLLRQNPQRRVNFEFHETGLEEQWSALVAFSQAVRPGGHRIAVEILGNNLSLVARSQEANLAYLVLDQGLTLGVHADKGRAALLRGLLKMASLMTVQLEAKGVDSAQDARVLIELGVHCLTGPAMGHTSGPYAG